MTDRSDLRARAQAALGPLEITLPPDLTFEIHISAIQSGMTPQELVIDILRDLFRVSETAAASTAQVA